MAINIFEGARRIALLFAAIVIIGTLIWSFTYKPYISVDYSIDQPDGAFLRTKKTCPSDAGQNYFSTKTSTGEEVSINLCLLAMSFGDRKDRLIPYKVDKQGIIWGAVSYSSEVSDYEKTLEENFRLPLKDEKSILSDISQTYWKEITEAFGYLIGGLVIFSIAVWAIGWIVRGFLGIPRGMDKKPD